MPVSASNKPSARTGATAGEPLPLLSYATIVQELGLDHPGGTVAKALYQSARTARWDAVWAGFQSPVWYGLSGAHYRRRMVRLAFTPTSNSGI